MSNTLVRQCAEGLITRPAIVAALERALALVRDTGARGFEPQMCLERGGLARRLGYAAIRERELCEANRLFVEMGATGHTERIAPLLAEAAR